MRHSLRTTLIASILALGGCASQGDIRSLQQDMDELKTRAFQTEKDVRGIRTETREGIDNTLKGLQKDIEGARKSSADLQAGLDASKLDIQVINGKLDDLKALTAKPAEDIALLKDEMDRRLIPLAERIKKLENALDEMDRQAAETKALESEKTPEGLYQKGLEAFKGGDSHKARNIFTRFIDSYPKHELTANARYWIGETYYSEKNFEQAILEFQEVIKNYPGREKAPSAMMKQAMAFKEIGDTKSASYVYKKLMEEYPASDEARKAAERIKELK